LPPSSESWVDSTRACAIPCKQAEIDPSYLSEKSPTVNARSARGIRVTSFSWRTKNRASISARSDLIRATRSATKFKCTHNQPGCHTAHYLLTFEVIILKQLRLLLLCKPPAPRLVRRASFGRFFGRSSVLHVLHVGIRCKDVSLYHKSWHQRA
jgi:hypothetical protein